MWIIVVIIMKNLRNIIGAALIILFIVLNSAGAQTIEAKAKIDTNNVLIGDQIHLLLEIKSDPKVKITWPEIPDSIQKIEIIRRSKIDTLDTNGIRSQRQTLVLTSFDSGTFVLPPFYFMCQRPGFSDLLPVGTDPMYLRFRTVAVDTTKPFKDIKPPLEEPLTLAEFLPYIIGAAIIIVLAIVGYFLWKRYKPKKPLDLKYDTSKPAHIQALESLKLLESEKVWQKGLVKEYHSRLTDIIRLYVERRYEIPALEMVTFEILEGLKPKQIDSGLTDKLRKMLELADMVKFAKMQPLPDENALSMSDGYDIVYKTIPISTVVQNANEVQQ
ncbi:MAG: hypothetical protein QG635_1207 [Bacteroidota bacterium]|nr:hypothetical protein [Bacteroidota bacterium]